MSNMPWFRVYSEILDDRKIKRICKKTGNSKALVIGVWICLLSLANRSPERGVLIMSEDMPYSLDDFEDETHVPREVLAQLIDEFKIMGMMTGNTTWIIANWNKRQFKSDSSVERVRAYRAKRYSNSVDTDSESYTESYTDNNNKAAAKTKQPNIFILYEQNIGIITPLIAEKLKEAEKDYPADWLEPAFQAAVNANARNWAYVHKVLENRKLGKDTRRNGNSKGNKEYTDSGGAVDVVELPAVVVLDPTTKEAWANWRKLAIVAQGKGIAYTEPDEGADWRTIQAGIDELRDKIDRSRYAELPHS